MIATKDNRGFALLVVLWTVALLALLGSYLVVVARERMAMAHDLRLMATLESAADGAMQRAIFEFLRGQWLADETIHTVRVGNVGVSVFLEDEALKLNPNYASAAELQALLQQLSLGQRFAATLAAAIVDWRTPVGTQTPGVIARANDGSNRNGEAPGTPFARLAELAAVPGMTPDIMQRLTPHLTLFAGNDPDLIPPPGGAQAVNAVRVIGIVAVARGPDRAMFTRHIIVRTNARRSGRRYEILMSERDEASAEQLVGAALLGAKP
jgi:general secretion pathway protein K